MRPPPRPAAGRPAEKWSLGVLRAAASEASAYGDARLAVRCLELCLAAGVGEQERVDVSRALVRALWLVNPVAAVRRHASFAEGSDCAAHAVRCALWNGDEAAAAAALGSLGDPADKRTADELRLVFQWVFGRALPTSEKDEDPWAEALRALSTVCGQGCSDRANVAAENILHGGRVGETTPEVLAVAVLTLMHGGEPERASSWCDRLVGTSAQRGMRAPHALFLAVSAEVALNCGRTAKAAVEARAALDLLPAHAWGVQIGYPLATLLLAEVACDRLDDAAATAGGQVPETMHATLFGLRYLWARGRYHLAAHHPLAALGDLQKCRKLAKDQERDLPALVPWRSDLAEANRRLGRRADREPAARLPNAAVPAAPLSAAERRVAELAALGHTNREISQTLYVTVSTVEQHLTKVYRKLGVNSRASLPAMYLPRNTPVQVSSCRQVAGRPA
ncbi:LuxR C-terminal-related transcriptional regulator [Amycolatopsis sp. NPDC059090]|uniref:helix-turn-helix transcriptional regulator n=1 Tax=Amycolatopsis sp. NPDC059090 TaxID=3346723 RepID=UPI00366CDE87